MQVLLSKKPVYGSAAPGLTLNHAGVIAKALSGYLYLYLLTS